MLRFNNKLIRLNGSLAEYITPPAPSGYKYFCWYVTRASVNTSDAYMQQDFAFYETAGTKITGFTSYYYRGTSSSSELPSCGFDGNTSTKWFTNDFDIAGNVWCIFSNDTVINPIGFSYMTGSDQSACYNRSPVTYKLMGSNTLLTNPSDSGWTIIYEATDDLTFYNVHTGTTWVDKYFL